jgi:hypothetical protein
MTRRAPLRVHGISIASSAGSLASRRARVGQSFSQGDQQ